MIKLITDATCDYSKDYYEKNNIELIPMSITLEGETFIDDKNVNLNEFYEKLRKGKKPTTSMISPNIYEEVFEKYLKNGDDVLYIGFSSGLSGCYNASVMAKKSLEEKYDNKIYCLDSLSASQGMGILLDEALKMIAENKSLEEICNHLEDLKHRLCILLGVENLFHLERGGRINKAQAIIGTTLNLKPIIKVNEEGKLLSFKKLIGRKKMELTLQNYVINYVDPNYIDKIFIISGNSDNDAEELKAKIDERLNTNTHIVELGTIIGNHTGNGSLAVIFVSKTNVEDIK